MKKFIAVIIAALIFVVIPSASYGLDLVNTILDDVWDPTSQSFRFSEVASTSGLDVSEETSLTNTVHPLATFTHTTDATPATNIGLSLDFYQETAAANTELGARIAVRATDVTPASEDFQFDWMLQTAGATAATKMSLGSTGVLTLVGGTLLDNSTASTLTVTETNIGLTGATTITGAATIEGGAFSFNPSVGAHNFTVVAPVELHTNATSSTVDAPIEQHTNTTSFTVTSPIFAAIQGTTGGWSIRSYEATTGALSGASGSCAVNVPAGAVLIGTQFRVDTLITSGDGAVSWTGTYATGSTEVPTTGQAFAKDTKANAFFDANAATAIMAGTLTITIEPNAGTFSAGDVRCISYAQVFTTMGAAP